MGKKIYCSIYNSTHADRLYLFAETSEGYFGHNIGSPTSATEQYESSSTKQIRVVAVPKVERYYCNEWYNLSSGATATDYGLLTFTGSTSLSTQNRARSVYGSSSGHNVVIIDDHGTHFGTPTTGTSGMSIIGGCVIGVKHSSTDSGWKFTGWQVEFNRGSSTSYTKFLSSFTSSEASTSGDVTTITSEYDANYAIVLQLGTSSVSGATTITALYEQNTEQSYTITFYNNSSVYTTASGTASSGILLPAGPTPSAGYAFSGWTINGTLYAANTTYYPSGTTYSIRADATYQNIGQKTLSYSSQYGTAPSSQTVNTGSSVSLASATSSMTSAASSAGFQFDGWLLDGTLRQPGYSFSLSVNKTATAQFSHSPVTVQYYTGYPSQPGSLITTVSNLTYGSTYTLRSAPTRSGYSFVGWMVTDKPNEGTSTRTYAAGAQIVLLTDSTPITAIALWTQSQVSTFTIHYAKGNSSVSGSDIPDVYVTEGNQVLLKEPVLWTYSGYTFAIWNGSDGNSYYPNDYITPTGNLTLTAVWDSNTVGGAKQDYFESYGQTTIDLQDYTKYYTGYKFYFSTSISTLSIELSYQYLSGDVGGYIDSGTYYKVKWERYIIVWDPSSGSYKRESLDAIGYNDQTNSYSTRISSTATIPADNISSSYSNNVQVISAIGYTSYDSRSSRGGSSSVTYTYTKYHLIAQSGVDTYTAPQIANYTFKGWYSINASSNSGSSSSEFTKTSYTHLISSSRQISLSTLASGCNYLRTSYTNNSTQVSYTYINPVRLVYEGVSVTVTYDANGGTCEPYYKFYRYGDQYGNLPTPTNDGGTFLGWYTATSGGTKIESTTHITNASDHSIYAHWEGGSSPNTYTVTFVDLSGTNTSSSRTFTRGVATALPWINSGLGWSVPTGYTLDQNNTWNTSSTLVGTSYANHATVTDLTTFDSVTLYAAWQPTILTITLNPNGGTVSPESLTIPYGSKYGYLPVPTSTPGNNFIGWFTSSSGGTEVTSNNTATQSRTLYAHWESQSSVSWGFIIFNIVLNTNGGTLNSSYEAFYYYGSEKTLPTASQITYSGKTFGGWYENSSFSGSAVTTIPSGATGEKTYYAKWS